MTRIPHSSKSSSFIPFLPMVLQQPHIIARASCYFSISGQSQRNEHFFIVMQKRESSSREVWCIFEYCLPFRCGKCSIQSLTRVCINGGDHIVRGLLAVVTSLELSYRQPLDSFELPGER